MCARVPVGGLLLRDTPFPVLFVALNTLGFHRLFTLPGGNNYTPSSTFNPASDPAGINNGYYTCTNAATNTYTASVPLTCVPGACCLCLCVRDFVCYCARVCSSARVAKRKGGGGGGEEGLFLRVGGGGGGMGGGNCTLSTAFVTYACA